MKKNKNKKRERKVRLIEAILIVLLLILFFLLFLYYQLLMRQGTGLVDSRIKKEGPLTHLLTIYGPGGAERPYFSRPNDVAIDGERIYVTDTGNNRVCVFNLKGTFLLSFGNSGVAFPAPGAEVNWVPGSFNYPFGIDVDNSGRIFVADTANRRIQVFSSEGRPLFWFPFLKDRNWADVFPLSLDINGDRVYVADGFKKRIAVFDLKGNYLFSLGERGRLAGMIAGPLGVAAAEDGTVYITDNRNLTLTAYQPLGKVFWVRGRPPKGIASTNRFFGLPAGVAVDNDGFVYLVDAFSFSLKIFNREGEFLVEVGRRGTGRGEFNFPRGVKVYKNLLAVADMENNRVQIFRVNKKLLISYQKNKITTPSLLP